jgi:hypothetical protein
MYIWLKNKIISLTVYFFDLYINIYLWIQNNNYFKLFFVSKPKHIEPQESQWISICSLYYNKKYDICTTFNYGFKSIELEYTSFNKNRNNIYGFHKKEEFEIREHLFFAKTNNIYLSRTFFPGYKHSFDNMIQKKSNIEFTYIEYIHPKMTYVIELNLADGIWIVGNELFTPAFILRLLEHQSSYYYFDLDYTINIVDHNIHNITLSSNSYIVLDNDTYHIITI